MRLLCCWIVGDAEPLRKIFGETEEGGEPSDGDNTTDKVSEEDGEQESSSMGQPGETESSETVPTVDSGEKDSSDADKPLDTEPGD